MSHFFLLRSNGDDGRGGVLEQHVHQYINAEVFSDNMDPAEDTIVTLAPSVSSFQTVRTSGLEVLLDRDKEIWRPLDLPTASDSPICALLFGWCANIRSNGHVPTVPHYIKIAMNSVLSEHPDFRFGKFH